MSNDMISMQEKALAADIRHSLNDKQQLHLDQIEMRIRDHRERFTLSLLEIGRCLNEAKEAKLVSHGHWQEWIAVNTGFTVRAAQRVMLAAREIPKTSTLTLLDFSKIAPLLALPAEEREAFAADVDAHRLSVRQLDAAVRGELRNSGRKKQSKRQRMRSGAVSRRGMPCSKRTPVSRHWNVSWMTASIIRRLSRLSRRTTRRSKSEMRRRRRESVRQRTTQTRRKNVCENCKPGSMQVRYLVRRIGTM
mgnify:CR=1 FL=1